MNFHLIVRGQEKLVLMSLLVNECIGSTYEYTHCTVASHLSLDVQLVQSMQTAHELYNN